MLEKIIKHGKKGLLALAVIGALSRGCSKDAKMGLETEYDFNKDGVFDPVVSVNAGDPMGGSNYTSSQIYWVDGNLVNIPSEGREVSIPRDVKRNIIGRVIYPGSKEDNRVVNIRETDEGRYRISARYPITDELCENGPEISYKTN